MHADVILTNKRRAHEPSNYTNTTLKAWFRRLLYAIRPGKEVGLFYIPGPTWGGCYREETASSAYNIVTLRAVMAPKQTRGLTCALDPSLSSVNG